MATKSICVGCKHRHNYFRKPLTKTEAWCLKESRLVKNKRNCIHFNQKGDGE